MQSKKCQLAPFIGGGGITTSRPPIFRKIAKSGLVLALVNMLFFAGCADKPVEPNPPPPFEGDITIHTDVGYDIPGYLSIPKDTSNNAQGERIGEWFKLRNMGAEEAYVIINVLDSNDFLRVPHFVFEANGGNGRENLGVTFKDGNGNTAGRHFVLADTSQGFIIDLYQDSTEINIENINQIIFDFGNSIGNQPRAIIYIKDDIRVSGSVHLTYTSSAPNTFQEIMRAADVVQKTILASETGISASVGGIHLRRLPLSSPRTRTYTDYRNPLFIPLY